MSQEMKVLTSTMLRTHLNHDLVVAVYGANIALECETCFEVMADFDLEAEVTPTHQPAVVTSHQPLSSIDHYVVCSCGCGATKPDDGLCECGQRIGHA